MNVARRLQRATVLSCLLCAGVIAMAISLTPRVFAAEAAEEIIELEPLVVNPPYAYESDRSLRRLRRQLPELGGTRGAYNDDWVAQFWNYLLRDPRENLTPAREVLIVRMLERDPSLRH